jgi:hypothetical protein
VQGGHNEGSDAPDGGAPTNIQVEVPELRLVSPPIVCPGCGAKAVTGDTFCTACGHGLTVPDPAASVTAVLPVAPAEQTLIAPPPKGHHPVETSRRRSKIWATVGVLAVAAVLATVALAFLWRSQVSHSVRLQHKLDTTTAQLATTRSILASTQSRLAATSALSARRRAVLLKARAVLTKVDPLLSSVDGVQQQAGSVQGQGSTLSGDAESLIQTTVTLVNYLVANGSNSDSTYVNALIDQANSELDAVRADEVLFASDTGAYDTASTAFGNKADAFSAAVRSLQTQLKGVAGP